MPRQIYNPVVMETRGGGDGSRPRSSGLPTLKKDAAVRDRTPPRNAIRRQRERPYDSARRRETPSQTTQKKRGEAPNRTEKERRREAPTRDTKEGRGKKRLKSHPERRRRTRQPATAQEGRGWTRYVL
ncbi:hypothetical protein NDU88_003086 [Pleurodeles waltl]|uniref:Uncharacterized protein n=1 Tax=Pleurodeles waltl TaxID=8319 RepID=A0AAV7MCW7_PLEWA|nr:hypothetical protein NDU88_003086 [Pleurodeles waltl]